MFVDFVNEMDTWSAETGRGSPSVFETYTGAFVVKLMNTILNGREIPGDWKKYRLNGREIPGDWEKVQIEPCS